MSAKFEASASLSQARMWLQSVVDRYGFLMHSLKSWDKTHDVRSTEEHFLAMSLKHSIDWLIEAERHTEELREISKPFRKSIDQDLVIRIRNKREHFIGSFKGHDKKNKTTRKVVGGVTVELDATSTIIIGDSYLLGGVDIAPIAKDATILIEAIKEIERKI